MNFPSSLTLLIDVNFLSTKIGSFFTPLTVIMFPFATLTKKTSAWIVASSAPSIASVLVAADAAIYTSFSSSFFFLLNKFKQ